MSSNELTANGECRDHIVQCRAAVTKLLLSQYSELHIEIFSIVRHLSHAQGLRQSFMFVKMRKVGNGRSENNDNELVLISV